MDAPVMREWTTELENRIRIAMISQEFPHLFRDNGKKIRFEVTASTVRISTGAFLAWRAAPAAYERLRQARASDGDVGVYKLCSKDEWCYVLQLVLQSMDLAPRAPIVQDWTAWQGKQEQNDIRWHEEFPDDGPKQP